MAQTKRTYNTLVFAALLSTVVLAGCMDGLRPDGAEVHPVLTVDQERAWAGQDVIFDAQASRADGTITSYRFDFGDGQTFETDDVEESRVTHTYDEGGVYTATLTITAEMPNGEVRDAATDAEVVIDQRIEVSEPLLTNAAVGQAEAEAEVPVNEFGSEIRFELEIENRMPVGESNLTVRLLDPSEQIVFEESGAVADNTTYQASVPIGLTGPHRLELVTESGAIAVEGTVEVLYATG